MAKTTENAIRSELEDIQERGRSPSDIEGISVEHREAAPETRPEGIVFDVDERVLFYDFWQTQRDCLDHLSDDEQDIVAFLGGYRSGKSVTGARWVLSKALEHPGSRWLAMGQNYSKADGTTYRVLFENLPGERTHIRTSSFNGPEESPIVADYNRQEHRITLINDAVIVLGSADKWSRYAGDEYAGIWLDEPSHYGDELHDLMEMMGTRLTAPEGPKVMFWTLTGNGYNAAWEVLEKREDADGNTLGARITLERASVLDNPYIAEGDKESLRRQYEGSGREEQVLHGGFAAATGLVYSNFSRETHVISADEAREKREDEWRLYGYDAGWNDPRVLIEIGKTAYGQLVVLDEFYRSESHVEHSINWLEREGKPYGTIFAEHEPSDIQKLEESGNRVEKAEKSIDAGIDEVRDRLSADESERVGLLVSEACEHTIREFLGYKQEQVGTTAASDHCLDALRYAVMGDASGSGSVPTGTIDLSDSGGEDDDGGGEPSKEFRESELGEAVLGALDSHRNGTF